MNNFQETNPEVFDINTLSKYLGCSPQTIRGLVKENKLPTYKLGRKYFFRKNSIDEWLELQEKHHKLETRTKDMEQTIKRINDL